MPNSLARSIPVLDRGNSCVWSVLNGRFGAVYGEAARIPIGTPLEDVVANRPDLAALFARLLSGEHVNETMEWDGTLWHLQAGPILDDGKVIGCMGISYELQRNPEPPKADPRMRRWEVSGLPFDRLSPIRDGDHFIKIDGCDGVGLGRRYSDADFQAWLMEYSPFIRLTQDTKPPIPSPRSHLQLLPPSSS